MYNDNRPKHVNLLNILTVLYLPFLLLLCILALDLKGAERLPAL
jgi:hypothetical protein